MIFTILKYALSKNNLPIQGSVDGDELCVTQGRHCTMLKASQVYKEKRN